MVKGQQVGVFLSAMNIEENFNRSNSGQRNIPSKNFSGQNSKNISSSIQTQKQKVITQPNFDLNSQNIQDQNDREFKINEINNFAFEPEVENAKKAKELKKISPFIKTNSIQDRTDSSKEEFAGQSTTNNQIDLLSEFSKEESNEQIVNQIHSEVPKQDAKNDPMIVLTKIMKNMNKNEKIQINKEEEITNQHQMNQYNYTQSISPMAIAPYLPPMNNIGYSPLFNPNFGFAPLNVSVT